MRRKGGDDKILFSGSTLNAISEKANRLRDTSIGYTEHKSEQHNRLVYISYRGNPFTSCLYRGNQIKILDKALLDLLWSRTFDLATNCTYLQYLFYVQPVIFKSTIRNGLLHLNRLTIHANASARTLFWRRRK